ncbi:MAG: metal ABC transporter substrate-binding protein [Propionibacteriaceae bacterium]|nr:metal ABC transporter substrate-binding protein [Propionibacteriaceae bacterium]
MKIARTIAAAAATTLFITGCSASGAPAGGDASPGTSASTTQAATPKLNVVVAFYPLQYLSEQIAGDTATVTSLTAPGTEAHDLELTPQQIASLGKADLVVYQKGFQAQVDAAVEQEKPKNVLDVASVVELKKLEDHDDHADDHGHDHDDKGKDEHGHDHGGVDPHVWLDPLNMAKIAEVVGAKLSAAQGADKASVEAATKAVVSKMGALDEEFKTGLASCKRHDIIVSHEAFGYLTSRYGLHQIGISGLSPDAEPSPARIAEVHEQAKKHGVTTVFYEALTSPEVAKSIAGDLGLATDVLDPLEGLTKDSRGKDYVEVMRANLTALKTANDCT